MKSSRSARPRSSAAAVSSSRATTESASTCSASRCRSVSSFPKASRYSTCVAGSVNETLSCCDAMSHKSTPSSVSCAAVQRRPLTYARLRLSCRPAPSASRLAWTTRLTTSSRSTGNPAETSFADTLDAGASSKSASTSASSAPLRTSSGRARAPSTSDSASTSIDLPAPVSPVTTLKPGESSSSSRSINTIFRTLSWASTTGRGRARQGHERAPLRAKVKEKSRERCRGHLTSSRASPGAREGPLTYDGDFHYPACGSASSSRAANQSLFRHVAPQNDGHLRRDAVTTHLEKEAPGPRAGAAEGPIRRGAHGVPRGSTQGRARRGSGEISRRPRHELDRARQRARGRGLHAGRAPLCHGRQRRRSGVRLEPATGGRRDPSPPRGAQLRSRTGDQAARADHRRYHQADLLRLAPRRGGREDGQVPERHSAAPPLLSRVLPARQDRLQASSGGRLDQRSRDAANENAGAPRREASLRHRSYLPVRYRQRQGREARHEPLAPEGRLSAGDHPL